MFAAEGRFYIDEEDDNKFWLARATYFVTDYSEGFINFCMTAKKPAIRMVYTEEGGEPSQDEWGWTLTAPAGIVPVMEQMDMQEKWWTQSLLEKQQRVMPTLGRNFTILAEMIRCILNNDDPGGVTLDKGHTPCKSPSDMLILVSKWVKHSRYFLRYLSCWLDAEPMYQAGVYGPQIWLLLLRRALLPYPDTDTFAEIAPHVDKWLGNTLESLPLRQCVGLLRFLMRKYPSECAKSLLLAATFPGIPGPHKKRALFFLLMEWVEYDPTVIRSLNDSAQRMPQYFSQPVLDKLNRLLPLAMKVPLPLRRLGARVLGVRKPLAKKYWQVHRALA